MNRIIRKYRPVGTVFVEEGVSLMVMEQNRLDYSSCRGCYYNKESVNCRNCAAHGNVCTPFLRKDNKNVIFVSIRIEMT